MSFALVTGLPVGSEGNPDVHFQHTGGTYERIVEQYHSLLAFGHLSELHRLQ